MINILWDLNPQRQIWFQCDIWQCFVHSIYQRYSWRGYTVLRHEQYVNIFHLSKSEHISRVSCQKGPTRHAYAWRIGPFWQDTLDIRTWMPQAGILVMDKELHSILFCEILLLIYAGNMGPARYRISYCKLKWSHNHLIDMTGYFWKDTLYVEIGA